MTALGRPSLLVSQGGLHNLYNVYYFTIIKSLSYFGVRSTIAKILRVCSLLIQGHKQKVTLILQKSQEYVLYLSKDINKLFHNSFFITAPNFRGDCASQKILFGDQRQRRICHWGKGKNCKKNFFILIKNGKGFFYEICSIIISDFCKEDREPKGKLVIRRNVCCY